MEKSMEIVEDLLKIIAKGQQYEDHKVTIQQITSGGANYSSYIYTATICSPGKEDLKVFFKIAALGPKMREMAAQIYSNEVFFYTEYMDICRHLEDKHKVPQEHRLRTAKYYASSSKESFETLVLEDLVDSGYQNFNRFTDLSWDQNADSLEQLAKYHALSLALAIQNPEQYTKVKQSIKLAGTEEFSKNFINSIIARVIEATEDKNKDRIANFMNNCLNNEHFSYFCRPIRKEVIIHGDYRPNNLMYKIEVGNLDYIRFRLIFLYTDFSLYTYMNIVKYQQALGKSIYQ